MNHEIVVKLIFIVEDVTKIKDVWIMPAKFSAIGKLGCNFEKLLDDRNV